MTTADDDLNEFLIDVPAGNDDSLMTLREFQEAVEDESHPLHAEAVQRNRELVEQLKPAIDRLSQTIMEQTGMKEQLARVQETVVASIPKLTSTIDLPKLRAPMVDTPEFGVTDSVIEQNQSWQRSMREHQEELQRTVEATVSAELDRQEMEDQRAQQTLDVLVSMNSNLMQVQRQITTVNARIKDAAASSSKAASRTHWVAVLTLLVSFASVVITVVLNW